KVTIPEGIWQHKLAELLENELRLDAKRFLELTDNKSFLNSLNIVGNSLEGYLLPNTYLFYENSSIENVIRKLKSEMDKIFIADSVSKQMSKLNKTKNEILTLASIIDGETNKESELKLISGVYHNRLKKGIRLQADPTIQYLKRHKRSKNKVYYKDLEVDSPYNTYKNKGLPPSPINNPGKNAVLAAIFPEKTDYIFFVADGTGGHKFAEKLSDHNNNVRAYRRWRSSQ
nr:endolytic transglycosylase MltG [Melioribacteraceae bacterium]